MYFNRFDIVEAHYLYAMLYHSGQWSDLYARLSRISQYYKPGPLWGGPESLSDNARMIFEALVEKGNEE